MRADRLLSIVLLLQIHRRMTAHELARRLEVSDRTIYRDMDALSAAGIPVYAERGTGGGCSLLEAYRTNLTGLTEAEVRTLFLPGTSRLVADLGLSDAFEAAFLKLLAALPPIYHRAAEDARQRIYVDTTRWNYPAEHVPHLHTIQEAATVRTPRQLRPGIVLGSAVYPVQGEFPPLPGHIACRARIIFYPARNLRYRHVRAHRANRSTRRGRLDHAPIYL